jgi:hypothetical protein
MENINEKISFRDWLKEAVEAGKSATFRADPIVVATDSAIIQKTVFPGIDVLTSPAEAFLRQLGVSFYGDLNGQFVLPAADESTAKFVNEAGDASSANLSTSSLTLSPRRISHSQSISKETLNQVSPAVYAGIVQNLVNGVWNCVTNDVFDQIVVDCPSSLKKTLTTYASFSDYVGLEASIGGKILTSPAYVITPKQRAYQSVTPKMTNQEGVYANGMINGYPAYGVPAQNTGQINFGDWAGVAVGQWGSLEIIVDPYTNAKKGLIDLTIVGMFDTGVANTARIYTLLDGSVG